MTTPVTTASRSAAFPPSASVPIGAVDVRKSYTVGDQELEVLHGVSLNVDAGEIVAVMGPSGSGKSPLMNCLAGLEAPSSGSVILAGRPLERLSHADLARMRRSEVGFVFQQYNLVPTLTAMKNVELPYILGKRRRPKGLIEQTLMMVGLADRMQARPPLMSGGEQQRVALARVLAPVLVSPLARLWTAAVPLRSPAWKIVRRNIYTRGARFSRSVIPVVFTIGLMLGILSLAPTIEGTVQSVFGKGETMSNAGIGAFLSMMGWALAIALAGGVGNVIMMSSKQWDADLALTGISGATPAQRVAIALIEGLILTMTATMLALVVIVVEAVDFQAAFSAMGFDPVFIIPPQAWIVGCGGTLLIMLAAMALPTLPALRRPEPRVVARLVAE